MTFEFQHLDFRVMKIYKIGIEGVGTVGTGGGSRRSTRGRESFWGEECRFGFLPFY